MGAVAGEVAERLGVGQRTFILAVPGDDLDCFSKNAAVGIHHLGRELCRANLIEAEYRAKPGLRADYSDGQIFSAARRNGNNDSDQTYRNVDKPAAAQHRQHWHSPSEQDIAPAGYHSGIRR